MPRQPICSAHGRQRVLDCPRCEVFRRQDALAQSIATRQRWDVMATLTFDPDKAAGPSGKVTPLAGVRKVQAWLKRSEHELGRPVKAVMAQEHHRSGEPHYHGLLTVGGGLVDGDELKRLWTLWYEPNGAALLEEPRSVGDAIGYASKYIVKDPDVALVFYPDPGALRRRD